ncbi:trimethylamine methyltransferase family protein [Mesorhizobium sp. BR-1-1-8]|nr:trimethylamine methyltransferase family protein [Mesorhizobium sp. BR-1-1-8]
MQSRKSAREPLLRTAHTLARYENAFFKRLVSDWSYFENWQDKGSPDASASASSGPNIVDFHRELTRHFHREVTRLMYVSVRC